MKYNLRFLPCIEDDAVAGYSWYEEKAPGCGDDFLQIFYTCLDQIELNPLQYPKLYLEFRRSLLRKFPYAIYYKIERDIIIVFGLFHCARNPQTIRSEMRNRDKNKGGSSRQAHP
jgi:toxin ParE1/3/4